MNEPKKTGTEASTETKHDLVPPTGETTEGDVSDQELKGVAGGIAVRRDQDLALTVSLPVA